MIEHLNGFGRGSSLGHAEKNSANVGASCSLHFLRRLLGISSGAAALVWDKPHRVEMMVGSVLSSLLWIAGGHAVPGMSFRLNCVGSGNTCSDKACAFRGWSEVSLRCGLRCWEFAVVEASGLPSPLPTLPSSKLCHVSL